MLARQDRLMDNDGNVHLLPHCGDKVYHWNGDLGGTTIRLMSIIVTKVTIHKEDAGGIRILVNDRYELWHRYRKSSSNYVRDFHFRTVDDAKDFRKFYLHALLQQTEEMTCI